MDSLNKICWIIVILCLILLGGIVLYGCNQRVNAKLYKDPIPIKIEIKETPPKFEESKQDGVNPPPKPPQRAGRK